MYKTPIVVAPARTLDDYLESVRRAEAEPLVLDPTRDAPADVVRDAAGILLLGGPDVEPSLFGEAPHPTFEASEPGRDAYETELIRLAIERDIPLLAICRGIQILNVALGGTLIQDIPTQVPAAIRHTKVPDAPKTTIGHNISVSEGSRLRAILGAPSHADGTYAVNSRHHQAVKDPGRDLVVTAVAPDGIVEAIERPASTFCVGVQWHPENFVREGGYNFASLFRAFVTAASRPS
jgi:putative glutamine amidotransferase